jgi:hypothetical protein
MRMKTVKKKKKEPEGASLQAAPTKIKIRLPVISSPVTLRGTLNNQVPLLPIWNSKLLFQRL